MLTESCPKVASRFCCEICEYFTSKKSSFDKHLLTAKHIKLTNVNMISNKSCPKVADDVKTFMCFTCNKSFKSRVGLWKHKIKCNINNIEPNIAAHDNNNKLIEYLMKENSEFKSMLMEQQNIMIKVIENGTNNNNNNTTNSHNKAFNLNFFLNETCKNAMNITDFVDSIKLQLSDLENLGEVGYVKGISDIITNNLRALDIDKRPIHCTDKKRETIYIKDQNKWEKEDQNNNKLRKVIKKVANKNITLITDFKKKYPDCIKSTSQHSDKYNKIIIEAMGGPGDNELEKEDKIIKNISDVTIIDKNKLIC